MLASPTFSEIMQMDMTMMPSVVERLIDKNTDLKKQLGPLMSLASFLK